MPPIDHETSPDQGFRQGSVSELLEYTISFNEDNTLEWNPPVGSKELAIALSYHFPKEEKLEKKMQTATMKFLRAEHQRNRQLLTAAAPGGSIPRHDYSSGDESINGPLAMCETSHKEPENSDRGPVPQSKPSLPSPSIKPAKTNMAREEIDVTETKPTPGALKIVSWGPYDKETRKTKKRRYGSEERVKVASNRGYACDEHRRQKVKCDPTVCPRNKQKLVTAFCARNISSSTTNSTTRAKETYAQTAEGTNADEANNSNISHHQTPGLDQVPFSPLLPDPSDPVRIGISEIDMPWQTFSSPTPMNFSLLDSTFIHDQKAFEESMDKFFEESKDDVYFPIVPRYDFKIKSTPIDPICVKLFVLTEGLLGMKLEGA